MKSNSFLLALFCLMVFLTNFAAQADLGNPKDVSDLLARCWQTHVVSSDLPMDVKMADFDACYKWPSSSDNSSTEERRRLRNLLGREFANSKNQHDKDVLGKEIRSIPEDAHPTHTADAQTSSGIIN